MPALMAALASLDLVKKAAEREFLGYARTGLSACQRPGQVRSDDQKLPGEPNVVNEPLTRDSS